MTTMPAERTAEPPGSDLEQRFNRFIRGETDPHPRYRYKDMLRQAGLRPTHQRMALAHILFSAGNRHVTAEMLYEEAVKAKMPLSLATVYNTLKQFTEVGLLNQIGVDGARSFFDTNPSEHHHFFIEGEGALVDIPAAEAFVDRMPQAPEGFEIARVSVVVRLRRKRS
jgi:Fur family transcriptional regulator, iron response regulator